MALLSRLWLILAALILAELAIRASGVSALVMPPLSRALWALVERPETFALPLLTTAFWSVLGLGAGCALGVTLAGLAWASGVLRAVLTPMALILASVPVVALMPILTHVFGSGAGGIVAVVAVITFLPVLIQATAGLTDLPPGTEGLFAALGAGRAQVFWRLALPAARPSLLLALRLAAPMAIFAAITAEYLTGQTGLGALIRNAMARFDIEAILAAALIACALSVLFAQTAAWAQHRLLAALGHN